MFFKSKAHFKKEIQIQKTADQKFQSHFLLYFFIWIDIIRRKGPSINDVGNFSVLWQALPYVGSFLLLFVGNFDQFLTPPFPITGVVYGQPLS